MGKPSVAEAKRSTGEFGGSDPPLVFNDSVSLSASDCPPPRIAHRPRCGAVRVSAAEIYEHRSAEHKSKVCSWASMKLRNLVDVSLKCVAAVSSTRSSNPEAFAANRSG